MVSRVSKFHLMFCVNNYVFPLQLSHWLASEAVDVGGYLPARSPHTVPELVDVKGSGGGGGGGISWWMSKVGGEGY